MTIMKQNYSLTAAVLMLVCVEVAQATPVQRTMLSLDSPDQWVLAADPGNVGKLQRWWNSPRPGAKTARVPGTMQETLGEYHGVAWYWRTVKLPRHPVGGERYILRLWSIDYLGEVWINGRFVGSHECADTMVEFDVTPAVRPEGENLVAVRGVNPGNTPIDGLVIRECPGRNKFDPWSPGSSYNNGGILDSVELLLAPPVRVESLCLRPDWSSGVIEAELNVRNASGKRTRAGVDLTVAPGAGGEALDVSTQTIKLEAGDTLVKGRVRVRDFRLWTPDQPVLYRVTARVTCTGRESADETSAKCGFRDFRFTDGYFRLNGKRIFLKSAHFGGDAPMSCSVPLDPSMLRKDFLSLKLMGFNMARCIAGLGRRYMIDLADEIGLLVYDECYASWCLTPSPRMAERWNQSVGGMIHRDRNHPSVVIWGLLNETSNNPVFTHAMDSLAFVKQLDDTRLVMLNSGRFDGMLLDQGEAAREILPQAWVSGRTFQAPLAARNSSDADINHDGTIFPVGALAFHVGPGGEPAVLRFQAPVNGEYRVTARFKGIAGPPAGGPVTTGAAQILAQGKILFSDAINCNGRPNETSYTGAVQLKKGEPVDFLSGSCNATFNSDTIRLDLTILGPERISYDPARDWSLTNGNPNGVWAYGYLPAGSIDSAKFVRFDQPFDGIRRSVGSLSNPGSKVWEDVLADKHPYQPCPHTAPVIRTLRTIDGGGRPLFISEYGFGSANDLFHLLGHYDQATVGYAFDRQTLDEAFRKFSEDWERWKMADLFGNMENYFRQCVAMEAGGRLLGTSAIRSNPHVVAHSLTACHDTVLAAEGLVTSFREPKPGVFDAMWDAWAPLRFCVFAEPVQTVRGGSVRVEVVLVNEDVLKPGKYPVRVQVLGPDGYRALDTSVQVEIPESLSKPEPAFATPVFSQDVKVTGPAGAHKLFAFFEKRASAEGGDYTFWVDDVATMPTVDSTVTLWGEDPELAHWLESHAIKTQPFGTNGAPRDLILAGNKPGADFVELTRRVEAGATALFLCPSVFAAGDQPTALLPLEKKGTLVKVEDWLYQNNDWAKNHPIFKGLPTGLLDYQFYREILGKKFFAGQAPPDEAIAGMINTSLGYNSGLTVAVYKLGEGRILLNSLLVRENLTGKAPHPVAERLLRNMLMFPQPR